MFHLLQRTSSDLFLALARILPRLVSRENIHGIINSINGHELRPLLGVHPLNTFL
jgi:hypothetical protein